jgi:dihydroorotase
MSKTIIRNVNVVNEGKSFVADVCISGKRIEKISTTPISESYADEINGEDKLLLPGAIDDQVHFREPGLTHKANIASESRAAVAGGITSFMEMPNTVPNTLTQELLQDKYDIAANTSWGNYSFFMGASNDNLSEVLKTNPETVCGIKVFMGSSTGNMLVDNQQTLEGIFSKAHMLVATHCEDEATIRQNIAIAKEKYGEEVPVAQHPVIRSEEACYLSSSMAVELAKKHNTRLHILHISTAKELELFSREPLEKKRITAEACVHHLWFTSEDYAEKGNFIKWNPAVKQKTDRDAIRKALLDGTIDVVATDHAPHTLEEKSNSYFKAPSGGPLVQHALSAMLEMSKQGVLPLERIPELMSHRVATCFKLRERGYIREGYFADLVLVNPNSPHEVTKSKVLYKCGWSPFEGTRFSTEIESTWVNGYRIYNKGVFAPFKAGERLSFEKLR